MFINILLLWQRSLKFTCNWCIALQFYNWHTKASWWIFCQHVYESTLC